MKIHFHKQSQFELFPGSPARSPEKSRQRFTLAHVTLSFENLIVLGVVFIMLMVVAFSWGVEKGKRMIRNDLKQAIGKENLQASNVYPNPEMTGEAEEKKETVSALYSPQEEEPSDNTAVDPIQTQLVPEKGVDKGYTVQVASFRKESFAQEETKALEGKGYEVFVLPKGKYYIVCVGTFAESREAKAFSQRLKLKYKDCFIRSL